jgi:hypothetical protein
VTVYREYSAYCDGCENVGPASGINEKFARRLARAKGWSTSMSRDYCPECLKWQAGTEQAVSHLFEKPAA